MEVEKLFSCWGSVGLSGILSLSLLSPLLCLLLTTLHLYTHAFSFYPSMSSYVSELLVIRMNDYLFPFGSLLCSCLQWMCFFPEALRVSSGVPSLWQYIYNSITSGWNSLHLRSVLHFVIWSAKGLVNIQ